MVDPTPQLQTVLLATGDVMLGRSVRTQTEKSANPLYPFLFVKDLLQSADITVINLENPLIDPCPKSDTGMKFCAPAADADLIIGHHPHRLFSGKFRPAQTHNPKGLNGCIKTSVMVPSNYD